MRIGPVKRMSSSTSWLIAIVVASAIVPFAAGFVALANIQYQRAREAERDATTRETEAARDRLAREREAARDLAALDREKEKDKALAREARAVLAPEVKANLALV